MRLLKSSQKITKTGLRLLRGVTENLLMCDNGTALSCLIATCSPTMFLHISFKYFWRIFIFFRKNNLTPIRNKRTRELTEQSKHNHRQANYWQSWANRQTTTPQTDTKQDAPPLHWQKACRGSCGRSTSERRKQHKSPLQKNKQSN
jgi:hypothetical protein